MMRSMLMPIVMVAGFAISATGSGAALTTTGVQDSTADRPPQQPAPTRPSRAAPPLVAVARVRTPFRFGGTPPALRWGETPPPTPPPVPVVERPRLVLTGIVWDRHPLALIEGIPGTEQAASLGMGAQLNGFRITRIEPTHVTIAGQDTTWHLEVRNPWP